MPLTSVESVEVAPTPAPDTFDPAEFFPKVAALVPSIIYVFNHETQSNEYSNHSIAAMLGYSPDEIQAMGDALFPTIIHPDDFPALLDYLSSLNDLSVGDVAEHEYRAVSRDGDVIWLRSNDAVFQMAEDGKVLRHIGCSSDVTPEKNRELVMAEQNAGLEQMVAQRTQELADLNADLEQQVLDRTAQLQSINDELEQLTYIATHDLKGPVSNMTRLTEMLSQDGDTLSEDQQSLLGWMRVACDKASEKLSALVLVAQSRSAELKVADRVVLADVARAACVTFQHEIESSGADVSFDFDGAPEIDFPVFEVTSILENLIHNGIKYHVEGRPIEVKLRSWSSPEGVYLAARDNGSGLNLPADAEKVFGLFKRAHTTPAGSGIALYTIKNMLDRYGGHITVDSVLGEWTEFELFFPYAGQAT